jgi:DNA-binding IscR family transcriptional regulator
LNESLKRFAALRQVLLGMEQDLGLCDLGETERRVLCAVAQASECETEISLGTIQDHALTKGISRSTFFRAMNMLVELGYIAKAGPEKRAGYILQKQD